MSAETALRTLLLNSVVGPIVGGPASPRIYPLVRPQNSVTPAITYQRIAEVRADPLVKPDPVKPNAPQLTMVRMQYDAWAPSFAAVVDLALKIQQVLKYATTPAPTQPAPPAPRVGRDVCAVWFDTQEQGFEAASNTYRVRMDFDVYTEE
jgi:hypothetical protein